MPFAAQDLPFTETGSRLRTANFGLTTNCGVRNSQSAIQFTSPVFSPSAEAFHSVACNSPADCSDQPSQTPSR